MISIVPPYTDPIVTHKRSGNTHQMLEKIGHRNTIYKYFDGVILIAAIYVFDIKYSQFSLYRTKAITP